MTTREDHAGVEGVVRWGEARGLPLVPLRRAQRVRAEGDPFSPAWAVVGRRRLRVREVLSRFLVEGEWWRGEEGEAIALRLLLEDGSVVTALSPLEEGDG